MVESAQMTIADGLISLLQLIVDASPDTTQSMSASGRQERVFVFVWRQVMM